jgi:hypothetical protein
MMKKGLKREKKTVLFKMMLTPSEKLWIQEKALENNTTLCQVVRHYYLK